MAGLIIGIGNSVSLQQIPQEYAPPVIPDAINPDSTQMKNPNTTNSINPGG